ncbi:carboxymuconolactone decarboxylase family protein [Streptomyces sp. G45]|uniref:carboxymuconolactone decarboxylase family protein n=1 Tax=Streptomyces sp. G45 TaxID=3406627 RepID=UPI003C255723
MSATATSSATTATAFTAHTVETAPPASRPAMEAVTRAFGELPDAVAKLAESPELLTGFLEMSRSFERATLEPLARETVIMTVAVRNGCCVCVALHTGRLRDLGADAALIAALRTGAELPADQGRLAAVRRFALRVLATSGGVDDTDLKDFLDHGHTRRNALEVVHGIGTYTMSTLANRLVRAV